jgi:hypothetical protein
MCGLLAVIGFLLAAQAVSPAPAPALPDSLGDWSAADPQETFVGDELFLYINGGADIYHEYGFRQVTVRDYLRRDDRIAVEVYEMGGDAFGIFSILRSDRAAAVDLCDGGVLGDYYSRFRCGNRLVVTTAQTRPDDARSAVLEFSRELASGLSGGGGPPDLLRMLPDDHRVPGSEAHIVGALGMRKVSPDAGLLFQGEAVAGRYVVPAGANGTILVLSLADDAAAADALENATKKASAEAGMAVERSPNRVDVTFQGGRALSATRRGRFVLLAVSSGGRRAARSLLELADPGSGPGEGGSR